MIALFKTPTLFAIDLPATSILFATILFAFSVPVVITPPSIVVVFAPPIWFITSLAVIAVPVLYELPSLSCRVPPLNVTTPVKLACCTTLLYVTVKLEEFAEVSVP